jgi:predicted MFS family arabinose efflux permease
VRRTSGTDGILTGRPAILLIGILCLAIFVDVTTVFAPVALLPFVAAGLGTSVSLVGQISSASILISAVIAVLIGSLVQRHGFRRLYLAGVGAMTFGSIAMALAPNVLAVLGAALLLSFANAVVVPVALALAAPQLSANTGRRAMSYQIACLFAAVAVGLPACVFLSTVLGWRGAFAVLAIVPLLLVPLVARLVPIGGRDPSARFDLAKTAAEYRDLLGDPSLALMFAFQVVYVICAFGTGAYASALLVSRGYGPDALEVTFAVVGIAFIVSSVATGEILGKLTLDLKLLMVGVALVFCLARGTIYVASLSFTWILLLFALASLCDGILGVAIRANVAAYDVRDRTLSMVFFAASDSFGQASGGVVAGAVLAAGGFLAVGELAFLVGLTSIWLPIASRRLLRPATVEAP